jgi:hypothetical protein
MFADVVEPFIGRGGGPFHKLLLKRGAKGVQGLEFMKGRRQGVVLDVCHTSGEDIGGHVGTFVVFEVEIVGAHLFL